MNEKLKEILLKVEKPARYIGGEYNTPLMHKGEKVRAAICFTDIYEIAMSNLGIQILYDILNSHPDVICERCFAPWTDFAAELKKAGLPLFSLETKKPLAEFDLLGFSCQYELSFTNILYMLDLAGIPFYSADRGENWPLVIAGGPCMANPEPIADFFDLIVIGDGEEVFLQIALLAAKYKGDKKGLLKEAAKLGGVYVPSLCEVSGGVCVTPVKKAVVADLDKAPYPEKPLVPNIQPVHDRLTLELFRGCYSGCRFCQAGFYYRPIRLRSSATLLKSAERLIAGTGREEIGLSALSSGDYPDIGGVVKGITEIARPQGVRVQLPSLRLDSFEAEITGGSRLSSLTFAPEAGTQRLRDVINKNITEEDIRKSMTAAFNRGYQTVKLYFMLGLPTENYEDLDGIAETVRKIRELYYSVRRDKRIKINVSANIFIPKPFTPFQWAEQLAAKEALDRCLYLRDKLADIKGVKFSYSDNRVAELEGVMARGDRTLAEVIEKAYRNGCIFDGWSEYFKPDGWDKAFQGIDKDNFLRERSTDEALPWDFIDIGVSKGYLKKEYRKGLEGKTTPSCKYKCTGCGADTLALCKGGGND
ncbi:MAG: TIGR03960 family B12-binding radical SAM protein [Christensenellales bacterium]|jgi:radical SAM family uncharacterized protein